MRKFPVSRRPDVRRSAEAMSAPGIDPRIWCSYAIVDDDPDAISIESGGIFVDVTLQPSGRPLTCRWGGVYSAPGGAVYFPIRRGDEVVVLITGGDESEGPVAMPRMHNTIDTFPLQVNGRDVDGSFPFVKIESGDWEIEVAGEVRIQGGASASEAARKSDAVEVTPANPATNPTWATWLTLDQTGWTALAAALSALAAYPPFVGAINVAVAAAATAAGAVASATPTDVIVGTITQGSTKCRIGGSGTPVV